jgi:hypothetical protein
MLTLPLAILGSWFLVSIVMGLGFGAWLRRLEIPSSGAVEGVHGWKVASTTKKNGVPVLLLARSTNSPPGRVHRQ